MAATRPGQTGVNLIGMEAQLSARAERESATQLHSFAVISKYVMANGRTSMRNVMFALLLAVSTVSIARAQDFEFVVVGDTRPRFASENFGTFEGLISKINAVKPAFVVNLGDLIYGYGIRNTPRQWNKYQEVIKAFRVPYYQIPGNHDTFSDEARKIYGQRFGASYSSFDYGGCHFVLLDNTEEGRWGYMGATEVEWLKADLKRTSTRSVFVFLHFPVWEPERVAPAYYEFWKNTLHPLFKASRVRAVFGGHFHSYGPTREIDGIPYFITGGGGAELGLEYKKAGGDFHFLRIRVSNGAS
jgi:3',5'-cyclic AMP phosphodiesterase CpdA